VNTHNGLPIGVEIHTVDDVFVKQMIMPNAGVTVPQHAHSYPHLSMLAVGRVSVWKDGVFFRDFTAPCGIEIDAHVKHTFMSLEPSIIYCIHNIARMGEVSVESEHQLEGG